MKITSSQLAAIFFSDVVEFSKKMEQNEEWTMTQIAGDLELIHHVCTESGGKVIKNTGDGLLVYFNSAIMAVSCGLEVQRKFGERNKNRANNEGLEHRIGIHLGDVFFQDSDVMGNGVNIAKRLQTEADPGGICISQTVFDVVKGKITAEVVNLGFRELKNIQQSVHVYQLIVDAAKLQQNRRPYAIWWSAVTHPQKKRLALITAAASVIILVGALLVMGAVASRKDTQAEADVIAQDVLKTISALDYRLNSLELRMKLYNEPLTNTPPHIAVYTMKKEREHILRFVEKEIESKWAQDMVNFHGLHRTRRNEPELDRFTELVGDAPTAIKMLKNALKLRTYELPSDWSDSPREQILARDQGTLRLCKPRVLG